MENKSIFDNPKIKPAIITIITLSVLCIILNANGYFSSISDNEALYTKGVIAGVLKGSKGSRYLHVNFLYKGKLYQESYTTDYCNECDNKCCAPGDSIIIKFKKSDPERSDVMHKLPPGVKFIDLE